MLMTWMDTHVDEDGIRQLPKQSRVLPNEKLATMIRLKQKGYLRLRPEGGVEPTPKAEAWWVRWKRRELDGHDGH